ncbi:DUF1273 family protein [Aquibacillus halophilus]|uniref:DUF1273 family protein n=1 Tax=Aquibacillus halophilus TaxID=930132 RepID=A0A6A8DD44_9BACI|nr:SLOG family protein [Aquibacillus halophilus]MRH42446.1 DUF1273 family protein [Aquibacillus halophilus]
MKIIALTGYKPLEMNIFKPKDHKIDIIKEAIKKKLISLIDEGLEWVLMSGQMGVEQWTSQVIIELKDQYEINFAIIPPFENQQARWPEHYQSDYEEIIMEADFFQTLYKSEYKGPYQFKARDKWLIDKSEACLILMDEEFPGSTSFFLEEAKKAGEREFYPILTITPFDLEEIVQEIEINNTDYWNND